MLDWLTLPIDASRSHDVGGLVAWHARLMTLAWGVLVPLGILAARFLKLWPGQKWPERLDHPGWWHLHRLFQYSAGALMLAGLWLILQATPQGNAAGLHRTLGWLVLGFAGVQFLSAWLRGSKGGPTAPAADGSWRGDHYDMTRRRVIFEHVHKFGGYLCALAALGAITSGLWQANAPRWMWIVLGLWWILCLAAFIVLQRRGFAFDTYQAHWGVGTIHPGNRVRPVGFGIRRHPAGE